MKNLEYSHGNQLEDEGLQAGKAENHLSIIYSSAKDSQTFLEIPMGTLTYLELFSGVDGELNLFCRYPTGSMDRLLSSYALKGHGYRVCYRAEAEGDYEIWFTLEGSSSNFVRFRVIEKSEKIAELQQSRSSSAPVMIRFSTPAPSVGLSAGGAKDINNFRENINSGFLPLPSDVTYEGLFYCYYFQIPQNKDCRKLFCPSYSYAISRDPLSLQPQCYLSVGLDSSISDFQRKRLNLVVVLDCSGSMSSPFNQYYYDRFGNRVETNENIEKKGSDNIKMNIAKRVIADLLSQLNSDDCFGLVIFSDDAYLVEPLTPMAYKESKKLIERIMNIKESGGTNIESGIKKGTELFNRYSGTDLSKCENRIIFLTDAMPNLGEVTKWGLLKILGNNAAQGIFTTFIGIGVDFNTELVNHIIKIHGANYYTVNSVDEFRKRINDEFDFMVTPLVFDLRLSMFATGYKIEKVYGSPEAEETTSELLKVSTLFPSKKEAAKIKGGLILIKLKRISSETSLNLRVKYSDRSGEEECDETSIILREMEPDFYQNVGIRKAILLSRYADLLKNWIIDERKASEEDRNVLASVMLEKGLAVHSKTGEWERKSLSLRVSEPYRDLFVKFSTHFQEEAKAIGDVDLRQEQFVLDKLCKLDYGPL